MKPVVAATKWCLWKCTKGTVDTFLVLQIPPPPIFVAYKGVYNEVNIWVRGQDGEVVHPNCVFSTHLHTHRLCYIIDGVVWTKPMLVHIECSDAASE